MNNSWKMWMLQNIYLIQNRKKDGQANLCPRWTKNNIDITVEITRARYSSILPSSTKGRGSLISGAELRLCRFTPGGTSIFTLYKDMTCTLLFGNYLSVVIKFWGFCRGRTGASMWGGECVWGYIRHVSVTAEVLMAGVWCASHNFTVASYTRSAAGRKAVVEAAAPRSTPQGRTYHVRNTTRRRFPQNNSCASCSGGGPVSGHYGLG